MSWSDDNEGQRPGCVYRALLLILIAGSVYLIFLFAELMTRLATNR